MKSIAYMPLEKEEKELIKELRGIFLDMGVNCRSKGFWYLLSGCMEALTNPSVMDHGITKLLYPNIAKLYNTKSAAVERCIRHAISDMNPSSRSYIDVFGDATDISNKAFINSVANYIRINSI